MSETNRPHRHLCPEAEMRDAMTDEEFWAHVYDFGAVSDGDASDFGESVVADASPCPECGESGACAWDSEGRPLIHAVSEDDA